MKMYEGVETGTFKFPIKNSLKLEQLLSDCKTELAKQVFFKLARPTTPAGST